MSHRLGLVVAVSLGVSAAAPPPAPTQPAPLSTAAQRPPVLDAVARQRWAEVIVRGLAEACRPPETPEVLLGALKARGWPQLQSVPLKQSDSLVFISPDLADHRESEASFTATLDHIGGSTNVTCTGYYPADDASEMDQAMIARFGQPNDSAPGKRHWLHATSDGGSFEAVAQVAQVGPGVIVMASVRTHGPRPPR